MWAPREVGDKAVDGGLGRVVALEGVVHSPLEHAHELGVAAIGLAHGGGRVGPAQIEGLGRELAALGDELVDRRPGEAQVEPGGGVLAGEGLIVLGEMTLTWYMLLVKTGVRLYNICSVTVNSIMADGITTRSARSLPKRLCNYPMDFRCN